MKRLEDALKAQGDAENALFKEKLALEAVEQRLSAKFTGERWSSMNCALPEGVALVHQDTPGTIFMVRKAADKEQLFIIEAQSLQWPEWPVLEMLLPSTDGLPEESRQLTLMSEEEQVPIANWADSLLYPAR